MKMKKVMVQHCKNRKNQKIFTCSFKFFCIHGETDPTIFSYSPTNLVSYILYYSKKNFLILL